MPLIIYVQYVFLKVLLFLLKKICHIIWRSESRYRSRGEGMSLVFLAVLRIISWDRTALKFAYQLLSHTRFCLYRHSRACAFISERVLIDQWLTTLFNCASAWMWDVSQIETVMEWNRRHGIGLTDDVKRSDGRKTNGRETIPQS